MKTITIYIALAMMIACAQIAQAQDTDLNEKIEQFISQKTTIVKKEREALKKEVEEINKRVDLKEINFEQAKLEKEEAARKRALNIENQIAIIDSQIALIERNGVGFIEAKEPTPFESFLLELLKTSEKEEKQEKSKKVRPEFVVAIGLNNVIADGQSLNNPDYKLAGSRVFEMGLSWKRPVFKHSNFTRLKYGISYQSNGLKPSDNRYFVQRDNQVVLEEFDQELDKSKFRLDHIVVPIHFEFGPSIIKKTGDKNSYSTNKKFKIGVGGYAGLRIATRQKLKYQLDGIQRKEKSKRSFNTSEFTYGLSSYIGFGDTSLYIKYDLSPIFKNALVDQNNISLGIRWDL